MNSFKRYDRETIESIGVGLTQYNSASELTKALNIDVAGLIKHIKKHHPKDKSDIQKDRFCSAIFSVSHQVRLCVCDTIHRLRYISIITNKKGG